MVVAGAVVANFDLRFGEPVSVTPLSIGIETDASDRGSLLVEMKEKGAVRPLQKIIEGDDLIPAVKDEAQMGILVLS